MSFISSELDQPIQIKGDVFWANAVGVGVKFASESQVLIAMLEGL